MRFGVVADDSGGTPLANTPAASLLRLALQAVFRPGDPVGLLSLLKHPLLGLGLERASVRHAAEIVELVALRGGTGRPDIASLPALFEARLAGLGRRQPPALLVFAPDRARHRRAPATCSAALTTALAPLAAFRGEADADLAALTRASVAALENLGRAADGSLAELYAGDAGEKLAELLRGLVAASASFAFAADEWPDVMDALIAPETVKPAQGTDRNIAIWGALEARLQSVDTLVIGGLNEGVWPRKPESDRFMSRLMKTGIDLEPPERRIGLAAHDFQMAMGAKKVVLARSARAGDAPAVPSRWLQRILTFIGKDHAAVLRRRGDELLAWARALDAGARQDFAPTAAAEAAADRAAAAFLGHRDRDAAPRPLRGLCQTDSRPDAARSGDPRSGCGRARHAVSRHPASLLAARGRSARAGGTGRPHRRRPGLLCRGRPSRRCRGRVVAALRKARRQHHRMGARRAPTP